MESGDRDWDALWLWDTIYLGTLIPVALSLEI